MFIEQRAIAPPRLEVATGTGFALLVALAAASRAQRGELDDELSGALESVGDSEGESWVNLLGLVLDADANDAGALVRGLSSIDLVELRRHLLGRYAWSWCTLAGIDDIEAAAAGDPEASARLLAHPRYYGGHADASLRVLLGLDPEETQRRIVQAVEAGARTLLDRSVPEQVRDARRAAEAALTELSPLDAVERLTNGFRYVPEPEAERVVLIPHLERDLGLVLAQHRSSRLIVYRAAANRGSEERLLALGRALADPKRVEILGLVGRGVGQAPDLVAATGLSRSTVHHHLSQLREVGLVRLEGNARAYTYATRGAAAADAAELVAQVAGREAEL